MGSSHLNLDAVRVGARRSAAFAAEHANGHRNLPEAVLDFFDCDLPAVLAELEQARKQLERRARNEARLMNALDEIRALHTDSPAGVCPSCGRIGDQSDTDDGLVAWPCPTVQIIRTVTGEAGAR